MKQDQNKQKNSGEKKKSWLTPQLEIIAKDIITSGSVNGFSEGGFRRYYSNNGAVTKSTNFS